LIKEAFLFFAIGIALYQLESWKQRYGQPLVKVLSLVLAVFILLSIKAYVFFLLFPFVLGPYTAQRSGVRFQFLTNLLVFLGWLLLLAGITPLVTGASLPELLAAKREEFIRLAHEVHAGSLIPLQAFRADWLGLIAEMPSALFRALLYPLPNQVTGILGALSALENGLMLTFILFMLSSRRKSPTSLNAYSWSALYLSIALMVLASLVTPVVGALVRYKVPALPFFLFYFGSMACSPAMDLPARWKSPPEK
jgi:hypothetical protein